MAGPSPHAAVPWDSTDTQTGVTKALAMCKSKAGAARGDCCS